MLEFFCLLTLSVLSTWLLAQLVSGNSTRDRETLEKEVIVFSYLRIMADILNKKSLDDYWGSNFNPFERKFFVGRGSNIISYTGSEQINPAILCTNRFGLFTQKFSFFHTQSVVLEVSECTTDGIFTGKINFIIKDKKGGLSEEQIGLIKNLIHECKDKLS